MNLLLNFFNNVLLWERLSLTSNIDLDGVLFLSVKYEFITRFGDV
jgi:hypothetical protein